MADTEERRSGPSDASTVAVDSSLTAVAKQNEADVEMKEAIENGGDASTLTGSKATKSLNGGSSASQKATKGEDFEIVSSSIAASKAAGSAEQKEVGKEKNNSRCTTCRKPGDLLCCDMCPKVYHLACIPAEERPAETAADDTPWYCARCVAKRAKRAEAARVKEAARQKKEAENVLKKQRIEERTANAALRRAHEEAKKKARAEGVAPPPDPFAKPKIELTEKPVKPDDADLIVLTGTNAGKKNGDVPPPRSDEWDESLPPPESFEDFLTVFLFLREWCDHLEVSSPSLEDLNGWLRKDDSSEFYETGQWLSDFIAGSVTDPENMPLLSKRSEFNDELRPPRSLLVPTGIGQLCTKISWPEILRLSLVANGEEEELVRVLSSEKGFEGSSYDIRVRAMRILCDLACQSPTVRKLLSARDAAKAKISERIHAEKMEFSKVRKATDEKKKKRKAAAAEAAAAPVEEKTTGKKRKGKEEAVEEKAESAKKKGKDEAGAKKKIAPQESKLAKKKETKDEGDADDAQGGAAKKQQSKKKKGKEDDLAKAKGRPSKVPPNQTEEEKAVESEAAQLNDAAVEAKKKWEEYQAMKEKFRTRLTPIGADRFHRTYWYFESFTDRVWVLEQEVEIPEMSVTTEMVAKVKEERDDAMEIDEQSAAASGEIEMESMVTAVSCPPIRIKRERWTSYKKGENLEALVSYLDPRGTREGALLAAIKRYVLTDKAPAVAAAAAPTEKSGGKPKKASITTYEWKAMPKSGEAVWNLNPETKEWWPAKVVDTPDDDRWDSRCKRCAKDDSDESLIVCERYPCIAAFHPSCAGFAKNKIPDGQWTCFECRYKLGRDQKLFIHYFHRTVCQESMLGSIVPYLEFREDAVALGPSQHFHKQVGKADKYVEKYWDESTTEDQQLAEMTENIKFDPLLKARTVRLLDSHQHEPLPLQAQKVLERLPMKFLSLEQRKTIHEWVSDVETEGVTNKGFLDSLLLLDTTLAKLFPTDKDTLENLKNKGDRWGSKCLICSFGISSKRGSLLCCDGGDCSGTYHAACVKLGEVPEEDWFCPQCAPEPTITKPKLSLTEIALLGVQSLDHCLASRPTLSLWLTKTYPFAAHAAGATWREAVLDELTANPFLFGLVSGEGDESVYGISGVWETPEDRRWWRARVLESRNQHALCLNFLMIAERFAYFLDLRTQHARFTSKISDDFCSSCIDDQGQQTCCDKCPRVFHIKCVGLQKVPKGSYTCPFCSRETQEI